MTASIGRELRLVCLIAGALFATSCASTQRSLGSWHYMRTRDEAVECALLAERMEWGGTTVAVVRPTSDRAGHAGFFRGLSGAPVFDHRGNLVGAVSATLGTTGDNTIGVMQPRSDWPELLAHVSWVGGVPSVDRNGRMITLVPVTPPPPAPGDVICVLELRGDTIVGQSGRVTAVSGYAALLLGHPYQESAGGNCLIPLLTATSRGVFDSGGNEYTESVDYQEEVGTVMYSGVRGCVALLGFRLPRVELRVSTSSESHLQAAEHHWEFPAGQTPMRLFGALADAIRQDLTLLGDAQRVQLTIDLVTNAERVNLQDEFTTDGAETEAILERLRQVLSDCESEDATIHCRLRRVEETQ